MTRHLLLVSAGAVDDQDEAFNSWYDDVHLADVLAVPGFVRAQRFEAVPSVHGESPAHRYLAVYELETDDLAGALQALRTAAKQMDLSPVFDRAGSTQLAFTALGPAQESR